MWLLRGESHCVVLNWTSEKLKDEDEIEITVVLSTVFMTNFNHLPENNWKASF